MNDIKEDIIYKAALTFTHEELAGMYAICNKQEDELQRKIKALRKAFFSLPVSGGCCEIVLLKSDFDAIVDEEE
jgi:hypothetical protein